jgi:hypothetical protein
LHCHKKELSLSTLYQYQCHYFFYADHHKAYWNIIWVLLLSETPAMLMLLGSWAALPSCIHYNVAENMSYDNHIASANIRRDEGPVVAISPPQDRVLASLVCRPRRTGAEARLNHWAHQQRNPTILFLTNLEQEYVTCFNCIDVLCVSLKNVSRETISRLVEWWMNDKLKKIWKELFMA